MNQLSNAIMLSCHAAVFDWEFNVMTSTDKTTASWLRYNAHLFFYHLIMKNKIHYFFLGKKKPPLMNVLMPCCRAAGQLCLHFNISFSLSYYRVWCKLGRPWSLSPYFTPLSFCRRRVCRHGDEVKKKKKSPDWPWMAVFRSKHYFTPVSFPEPCGAAEDSGFSQWDASLKKLCYRRWQCF